MKTPKLIANNGTFSAGKGIFIQKKRPAVAG
jgi:hypothetical protein